MASNNETTQQSVQGGENKGMMEDCHPATEDRHVRSICEERPAPRNLRWKRHAERDRFFASLYLGSMSC